MQHIKNIEKKAKWNIEFGFMPILQEFTEFALQLVVVDALLVLVVVVVVVVVRNAIQ